MAKDFRAAVDRGLGNGRCGQFRLCASVVARDQATRPLSRGARCERCAFCRSQHVDRLASGLRIGKGRQKPRHIRFVAGQCSNSGEAKAGVAADRLVHRTPEVEAHQPQFKLARIAAERPAPTPVSAGLFLADLALFAEDRGDSISGQPQRRADPSNTAADDDDVGFFPHLVMV